MSAGYLERVALGEDRGIISWVIRILLWPLSMLYQIGLSIYLLVYDLGLRKRLKLSVPVISIGNLTFGGTGKTPAVQTVCKMLTGQGKKVVVLSRGHGGSADGSVIVSDGDSILCDSSVSGDEPMLLAKTLTSVPVIVGKDRRISGRLAVEMFSPDVVVMDDGLQYWQLYRDLDIIVLNAQKPFGSGFVMPMGDLREPVSGLKRAGIILLSYSDSVSSEALEGIIHKISRLSQAACFKCTHKPVGFRNVFSGEKLALEWIKGKKIAVFCGIGHPEAFLNMLQSLGADIKSSTVVGDHYDYSKEDIAGIKSRGEQSGAEAYITTAKDLARLGGNIDLPNLYTLEIELEIEDSSSFGSFIYRQNDGKNQAAAAT